MSGIERDVMSLPGSNVETIDLKARNGEINETLLDDIEGDGGAGLDDGAEGECGGDGDGGSGLHLNGERLDVSGIN